MKNTSFLKKHKRFFILLAIFGFVGFYTGQLTSAHGFVAVPSPFFSPFL